MLLNPPPDGKESVAYSGWEFPMVDLLIAVDPTAVTQGQLFPEISWGA